MEALCINAGIHCMLVPPLAAAGNGDLRPGRRNSRWGFSLRHSLRPLWPGCYNRKKQAIAVDNVVAAEEKEEGIGDWVLKILHVKSLWKVEEKDNSIHEETGVKLEFDDNDGIEDCEGCEVDDSDDDGKSEIDFDRESFSKLLRKVTLSEIRFYGRMAHLGNLAYSIPKIEPGNLLRHHGLRFVTSSMEKKKESDRVEEVKPNGSNSSTTAFAAYQIADSAASYLHSHTKSILRFRSSTSSIEGEEIDVGGANEAATASLKATADSVTAVVAAKEEIKQAVADDLNSTLSSPCEWFVCDDDQTATRFFIIQGSESLASWQANLLFEPIQFEGMDVLVHRGIYEAAKGIYNQMLPEIRAHLKSHGDRATFYFTGHSLGGSLSLLVNLMLLIREEVSYSSLRPVIIFGAPSIMCGGNRILHKLGLPRNHVQSIMMHRDIVPRAFSCNYPIHVAEILKAINRNFRSLPCLCKKKLLYTPMGEFFILQPDDNFSPSHHLLPPGSCLYHLTCDESAEVREKHIEAAQATFLNTPHPLEILSDRSAYGFGGTIVRDHDMNSYVKCIRYIIRQELSGMRKTEREHRRGAWWEVMTPVEINGGVVVNNRTVISGGLLNFYGVVKTGKESLKRLSRLVASQHVHLLVMLWFPTRLIILGTCRLINYH